MARGMLLLLTMVAALAAMAPAATMPASRRIYVSSEDLASEESLRSLYERWYALYRRDGDPGDKEKRFATFKKEAHTVYELNQGGARTKHHLNWFADLTQDEFSRAYGSCVSGGENNHASARGGEKLNRHQPSQYYPDNLPITVDWRRVDGVLTSVKRQGKKCGSCWAFAAAGAMESVHFLENKVRTNLSVQQLVDCSTTNLGCKGGWASNAFQYVINTDGMESWEHYPYVGKMTVCAMPLKHPVMSIRSFYYVERRDEKMLMDAVSQTPVVVTIVGADATLFRYYYGGVYRGPCDPNGRRHQVLLVGYGTTAKDDRDDPDINYWVLKNSWGKWWGEKGYMRLQRGYEAHGGLCGIMLDPVYPANAYAI